MCCPAALLPGIGTVVSDHRLLKMIVKKNLQDCHQSQRLFSPITWTQSLICHLEKDTETFRQYVPDSVTDVRHAVRLINTQYSKLKNNKLSETFV